MGAATSDQVLRPEEVEELQEISGFSTAEVRRMYLRFIKLDSRQVGTVSKEDVMRIPELAMNPLVDRIVHVLGLENRSRLNFTEFLQSLAPFSRSASRETKLKAAFAIFDVDRDGFVTHSELCQVFKRLVGDHMDEQEVQDIADLTIQDADADEDGQLSFDEFSTLLIASEMVQKLTLEPWDQHY